jgi:hypothetical protein
LAAIQKKKNPTVEEIREYGQLDSQLQFLQPRNDYAIGDSGSSRYQDLVRRGGRDAEAATEFLKRQGIPGIRYLDGGSRSAGQGSSNFVAFDPEMIRILERNGQPTGLEPWKPGEYRLKDLIGKE